MLTLAPLFLIGGLVISRSRLTIQADVEQVWKASAARSEAAAERAAGRSKLLLVRQLEVSYGNVQVLFVFDLEVDEGGVVAVRKSVVWEKSVAVRDETSGRCVITNKKLRT